MFLNLTSKAKFAVVTGVVSLVGGSATLIHDIITTESVEAIIKLRNFELIDDDAKWAEVLEDYTREIKTQTDLKIPDFEGGTGKVEEFKKHCKQILSIKYRIADSLDLVDLALWCVKQQTVSDYLIKNKYTLLKTDHRVYDKDNPMWDKKIKEYLQLPKENTEDKISELKITNSSLERVDESDRTAFIEECKKLSKIKHFDKNFEQSYTLSALWCAEAPKENKS
ncbi:hypothetical protein A6V39_00190 [Candidatus Mycoplasma haematobovis]|uniref:Uncharacterized protein n=1 Tax=Candidatus Mycoplasma haematobovis TaxID=432608 RepID=A0A1A9QDY6_9MOLU|nr:hypothetical protein [Candidatus Mycoplasma haematobovis]OAL10468.1 hypothetical protein A6V39_00190 [Candidatus Mycoplasma haematobovis]